ncbi:MAG: hypothetical protein ACBR21_19055 [Microcoleus sp.]
MSREKKLSTNQNNCSDLYRFFKEEGRRKKEEGRRKKEEGRRKKEEGRRFFDTSTTLSVRSPMPNALFGQCPVWPMPR